MRKCLGIILVATMIPMLFFITPCQASPEEYLIWYHEQYNEDGTSLMIVWLYKMAEAEPNYDFYIIKIRVIGMLSSGQFYVRADIWSNGVCNNWEPTNGFYASPVSLSVTVGGVGFGINIPAETVGTTGGLMATFGWQCRTILGSPNKEFVSSWYVPDGVAFAFLVAGSEWFGTIGYEYCTDAIHVYYPYQFAFKTLTVQAGSYGTTSPKPRTYNYYPSGFTASVWARPYQGYVFKYWTLDGVTKYGSPIMFTMDSGHSVKAYFGTSDGGGGGGGCPTLFAWNGTDFEVEGLLDIHNPEGVDVVTSHTLVTTPQRVNGAYLMRLTEHPQTHSHIDEVKLYATIENGTTIELPLIWARHSEYGNVLPQLLFSDDWKTDTLGAELNNGTSQGVDLKFAALSPQLKIVGFTFQIEGNNARHKR